MGGLGYVVVLNILKYVLNKGAFYPCHDSVFRGSLVIFMTGSVIFMTILVIFMEKPCMSGHFYDHRPDKKVVRS